MLGIAAAEDLVMLTMWAGISSRCDAHRHFEDFMSSDVVFIHQHPELKVMRLLGAEARRLLKTAVPSSHA